LGTKIPFILIPAILGKRKEREKDAGHGAV